MENLKLSDIDILRVGNEIQICGGIYSDAQKTYLCLFPGNELKQNIVKLKMDTDDWSRFILQGDLSSTEVSIMENGVLVKAILRKSQRYIDSNVSWRVYHRDDYRCRYCYAGAVPLTVDHVDLWEDGGASILENLLSACRPCNKERGSVPYEDWIVSPGYKARSSKLPAEVRQANLDIVAQLPYLRTQRVKYIKSR